MDNEQYLNGDGHGDFLCKGKVWRAGKYESHMLLHCDCK